MIRDIGQLARQHIEAMSGRSVYLELRVKVHPGWRSDPKALKRFGFSSIEPTKHRAGQEDRGDQDQRQRYPHQRIRLTWPHEPQLIRLLQQPPLPGPSTARARGLQRSRAPGDVRNALYCKSSETMDELPDHSVHLMVTSPPYNASKEYDKDLTLGEYREMLRRVMGETYRVLVTGGRACINVANLGRKPYLPLHAFVIEDMLAIGFLMRGEIIWDKASSAGSSTAWGSWLSASNPVLRDVHEYILVFCKETFTRPAGNRVSTITKEDFLAWTKSVWTFPSASARQIGHPAPFPRRLAAPIDRALHLPG